MNKVSVNVPVSLKEQIEEAERSYFGFWRRHPTLSVEPEAYDRL